jgi:C_GCAxxG_C_C family probable redox protein
MKKKDKAIEYFRNKFNCSQAVFTVFGTDEGLPEDSCLKIGCGFGGGMGRQQLTCGALTGAVLALGLKYGKALNDPEEKKTETYSRTRELFEEFKKLNGSTVCRELLKGFDMNDPDDHKRITDLRLFEILCEKYVADVVNITEKMMNEHKDASHKL